MYHIQTDFTSSDPPKDEKFIAVYKKVMRGKIPFYYALIKKEAIKPYSSFIPKTSKAYEDYILDRLGTKQTPCVHVYQEENGFFTMSDDYHLFYFYLGLGLSEIPCYVLGKPRGIFVVQAEQVGIPQSPVIELCQKTL